MTAAALDAGSASTEHPAYQKHDLGANSVTLLSAVLCEPSGPVRSGQELLFVQKREVDRSLDLQAVPLRLLDDQSAKEQHPGHVEATADSVEAAELQDHAAGQSWQ